MKLRFLPVLIALACPVMAVPMTDAPNHDPLSERLRAEQQNDPMKRLKPAEGEDPTLKARPADLVATSDFLSFNGQVTLVPKGALLVVPENLKARVAYAAGAPIVPWSEFLTRNRAWLQTVEVSLNQAKGQAALPEAVQKSLADSHTVVVATFRGGPIGMVPPQAPTADEQAAVER